MDLGIPIAGASPGRTKRKISATFSRELGQDDLALLASADRGTAPPPIKKLRDRHHKAARLFALGEPEATIALATGYSPSRLSALKSNEAFQELVALYAGQEDEEHYETLNEIRGLSRDALSELRDRLEEEPESFSVKDLRELAGDALDRTGYPKATKNETTVNVNLSARLEAARQRALEAAQPLRDVTPPDAT